MKEVAIKYLETILDNSTNDKKKQVISYIIECVKKSKIIIKNEKQEQECRQVIDYLNQKCGTRYRPTESNLKFIRARLQDYKLEDLISVVDKKCKEWNGTSMQMYLRPETLFNATKFETYFNGLTNTTNKERAYSGREYSNKEFDDVFDNLDEVEI